MDKEHALKLAIKLLDAERRKNLAASDAAKQGIEFGIRALGRVQMYEEAIDILVNELPKKREKGSYDVGGV